MKRGLALFVLLVIILAWQVSASFELGNLSSSIQEVYSPGENIKGWINISFQDENVNSLFSGNEGDIGLKDFLDKNDAEYSCTPFDCGGIYPQTNAQKSKSFSLIYGQEKLISFVLNGKIQSITSLSFNVSASNQPSCVNPLKIDILDDNRIDWNSKKTSTDFSCVYNGGKGCFNLSASLDEVEVKTTPYCEKIILPESGKFMLGAWVRKSGSWQSGLLKMILYDLDGIELKNCNLPEPSYDGKEINCTIEYQNLGIQDFYVCIKAISDTAYKIKKESSGESCGFYAVPGEQTEYNDYYIFAKAAKFINVGSFIFNQKEYEDNGNLADDIKSYISDKYDNNCSSCSIPVKFKAYGNLDIIVSNLALSYSTGAGSITADDFYDTSKQQAKLSSGFIELDLSLANISVPKVYGDYNLIIKLNDESILNKKIKVESVPIINNIFPTIVPAAVPTKFTIDASASSGRNITSYKWNFDGEIETTSTNSITHTYSEIGGYDLNIEVEDSSGFKVSKSFSIIVGSPEQAVNYTIFKYRSRISNITNQLASMSWKDLIKEKIKLDDLVEELNSIERAYDSASSDEDYIEIMASLSEMKIPVSIKKSASSSIPFVVSQEDVELRQLAELGAGSYDEDEAEIYKKAIAAWSQNNLDMTLDFDYISAYYERAVENLIGIYNLKITPKKEQKGKFYIVIKDAGAKFKTDYKTKELDDAAGLIFENIDFQSIEFSSDKRIGDLNVYISPEFSLLEVSEEIICNSNGKCEKELGENWNNCREDCKPWGTAAILIVILFFVAVVIYILLQWWYKRKYEGHLFKNKNDVYNMLNFISNAKSQGLEEREIISKLKQAGWKGEQINYTFKKFKGKAIMPFDFIKLFKKQEVGKIQS